MVAANQYLVATNTYSIADASGRTQGPILLVVTVTAGGFPLHCHAYCREITNTFKLGT